jgi:hypothetical protein
MLTVSICSPAAAAPRSEPEEMGAVPSAAAAVTIAVVGTTPPAGQTPPAGNKSPTTSLPGEETVKKKSTL